MSKRRKQAKSLEKAISKAMAKIIKDHPGSDIAVVAFGAVSKKHSNGCDCGMCGRRSLQLSSMPPKVTYSVLAKTANAMHHRIMAEVVMDQSQNETKH